MWLNKTAKCCSDLGPCACLRNQTAAVSRSSLTSSALTTSPHVFFSLFSLLYLRLRSCFLLCPVSVEAVNCLSIPKDSRVLILDNAFSVMSSQFDSSHYDFGQHGCRICHSLHFCPFSHRPQTWCSGCLPPTSRVVQ
jgi:hypothetical protein